VTEAEQALALHVRDRAGRGHLEVAAYQLHTDRATVDEAWGRGAARSGTARTCLHRIEPERRELLPERGDRDVGHAGQQQRRRHLDGAAVCGRIRTRRELRSLGAQRGECADSLAGSCGQRGVAADLPRCSRARRTALDRAGLGWERAERLPDPWIDRTGDLGKHVLDRGDACDRLLTERPAVGIGADHLAIDVDRAAAHPPDRDRLLEDRVLGPDQDEILVRAELVQHVDDLDLEALRRHAAEHGHAVATHAGPDLRDRQDRAASLRQRHRRQQQRADHEQRRTQGRKHEGCTLQR
jgi:hypothetical protein